LLQIVEKDSVSETKSMAEKVIEAIGSDLIEKEQHNERPAFYQ
jgi:hypothetical protein